jgi:uncharacterized protein YxeA
MEVILILTPFAVIIGLVAFFFWRDRKRKREFLAKLTETLGAKPKGQDACEILLGDLKIEARIRQGRRRMQFLMSAAAAAPASFQITSGRKWIKLIKSFGRGAGAPTGDAEFDSSFFVDTNAPEWTADYLTPERRKAVAAFAGKGFYALELDGGSLTATWSPFEIPKDGDASFAKAAAEAFAALAKDIPPLKQFTPARYFGEAWFDGKKRAAWVAMFGSLVAMGWITPGEPIDGGGLALKGLALGALFLMGLAAGALSKFGGKAWFPSLLTRVLLPAAVALPLLGVRLLAFVNDGMDAGAPLLHEAPIVDKQTSGSGSDKTFTMTVKSWTAAGETEKVEVAQEEYDRATPGQAVLKVTTKPGRLGYEWIISTSIETISYSSTTPLSLSTAPAAALPPAK